VSRAVAPVALTFSPATAPPASEAIGPARNYRQARYDRPDESAMRHRAPLLRFPIPFSTHRPRCLPLVQRRPAFGRSRLHDPNNGAARDGGRLWGGSFGGVSSHEMTRLPSSITFWRRCDRCNRLRHARRRSSHIERLRLDFVPSARVMHRRVLCRRGVPLRGGPDIHGLARRCRSSFLPFLARRRSWVFLPFAGLFPRMGGQAFLPFRAHMSLRRRASAPDLFSSG
jgi:hypothetical protein